MYGNYNNTATQTQAMPRQVKNPGVQDPLAPQAAQPQAPAQGAEAAAAPTSSAPQPVTGRQQALQTVQAAYAAPTSYVPGNALGMVGGGLFDRLNAAPSLNDSFMAPAVAAGRMADQRNANRQRAMLAEQMGAQGLGNSGAENAGARKIQQAAGESQAARESGMLFDEAGQRRQALLQALGMDQSRYQFDNNLGFNMARAQQDGNQQALLMALGLI